MYKNDFTHPWHYCILLNFLIFVNLASEKALLLFLSLYYNSNNIMLLLTFDTTWNHKVLRINDVPKSKFCYGEL